MASRGGLLLHAREESSGAFLPVYPLAVRAVAWVLRVFPMYLALAVATADRPVLRHVLVTISAVLFGITTALFVNGYRLL